MKFYSNENAYVIQVAADMFESRGDTCSAESMRGMLEEVDPNDIAMLLSSAFDGPYLSWWCTLKTELPPEFDIESVEWADEGWKNVRRVYIAPLVYGGRVIVTPVDPSAPTRHSNAESFTLDAKAISRGLAVMRSTYPRNWQLFVDGDYDATTGDAFVQYCLFGSIVYG